MAACLFSVSYLSFSPPRMLLHVTFMGWKYATSYGC
jgi:hypothetical protein